VKNCLFNAQRKKKTKEKKFKLNEKINSNMRSSLEEPWPSNFWCRELFDKCTKEKKIKKKKKKEKTLNMKSGLEQPWPSNFKHQKLFNKFRKK
jgi:hypothetical protein